MLLPEELKAHLFTVWCQSRVDEILYLKEGSVYLAACIAFLFFIPSVLYAGDKEFVCFIKKIII